MKTLEAMPNKSPKEKVLIDLRQIDSKSGGFSTYQRSLLTGLMSLREQQELRYEPVLLLSAPLAPTEPLSDQVRVAAFSSVIAKAKPLSLAEWFEIPKIIATHQIALYHSTTFSSIPVGLMKSVKWITTLHDLNHLHYGSLFHRLYYQLVLRPFALGASKVMTVSKSIQSELQEWLKLSPEQFKLAYNAIDWVSRYAHPAEQVSKRVLSQFGLTEGRYFVCLANSKPHKNLEFLLEAYRMHAQGEKPWPLVILGSNLKPVNPVNADVPENSRPQVIAVPYQELESAYALVKHSAALFSPSLYEGFGLPPVEALVLGVPAIAAKIAPHLESLGAYENRGVSFRNPRELYDWSAAFAEVTSGKVSRPDSRVGHELCERYSAIALARTVNASYQEILDISVSL